MSSPVQKKDLFTSKDAEFMLRVVQNMEGKPVVNWDNVAAQMGLKNGNVAHVRFRQIKKKILADNDTPSPSAAGMGDAGSPSKGPKDEAKSVHKRCASKDLAATPTKKKGSKSAGKVKEEPDIEDLFSRKSEDKEDFYYEEEL